MATDNRLLTFLKQDKHENSVRSQTKLDITLQAILEHLNKISTGQDQVVAILNKLQQQQLEKGIVTGQEELRRDISASHEFKREMSDIKAGQSEFKETITNI
jgi:hypothetical protein